MLAESFGCTVNELLERITSYELCEWIAFYKIKEEEEKKAQKKMEQQIKRNRKR